MHRTVASELGPISSRSPSLAREALCFEPRAFASKPGNIAERTRALHDSLKSSELGYANHTSKLIARFLGSCLMNNHSISRLPHRRLALGSSGCAKAPYCVAVERQPSDTISVSGYTKLPTSLATIVTKQTHHKNTHPAYSAHDANIYRNLGTLNCVL